MSGKRRKRERQDLAKLEQQLAAAQAGGQGQILAAHSEEFTFSTFAGPLPPPNVLLQYERVTPGLADRVVSMGEKQEKHRHDQERYALRAQVFSSFVGQVFGVVVALGGFALAGWCVYNNSPITAAIVTALDVGGITGVFVSGTLAKKRQPTIAEEGLTVVPKGTPQLKVREGGPPSE